MTRTTKLIFCGEALHQICTAQANWPIPHEIGPHVFPERQVVALGQEITPTQGAQQDAQRTEDKYDNNDIEDSQAGEGSPHLAMVQSRASQNENRDERPGPSKAPEPLIMPGSIAEPIVQRGRRCGCIQ
jgi:hypothetical protein